MLWTSFCASCCILLSLSASVSVKPSADLQLGSKAQLQCQVKGLTQGPAVKWRNPGGSLHSSELQLDSVARSDAGTWKCMFSHDGLTYNESLEIRVTGRTNTCFFKVFFIYHHNGYFQSHNLLCFCFQSLQLQHVYQTLPNTQRTLAIHPAKTVCPLCACVWAHHWQNNSSLNLSLIIQFFCHGLFSGLNQVWLTLHPSCWGSAGGCGL